MSAKQTNQMTLDGEQVPERHIKQDLSLGDFAMVLWEVGQRDDLDDTEAQLVEANRICRDRDLIGGGE